MSESIAVKSYSLIADIKDKYSLDDGFNPKALSYPYTYTELNSMSYNTLNSKKYNNLSFAHAKSFIDVDMPINKTYSEVIICNKLV